MHTSIFLPSTTVPCSRSRAWSASALFANVTKPNPCMQDRQNMQCKKLYDQNISILLFYFGRGAWASNVQQNIIVFLHKDYTVNCTQNLQKFNKSECDRLLLILQKQNSSFSDTRDFCPEATY
ncbi:hypothetical protein J6590_049578 [Homalodisca vitripennis]|nr:hypothetical protein J6590_049578 [Homalodisca vitripennis]